jgi:uncharacterized protein YaiI (UPF0178 family)
LGSQERQNEWKYLHRTRSHFDLLNKSTLETSYLLSVYDQNGENEDMKSKQIWVDADACPNVVKDILFRAANRVAISLTLVANQAIQVPRSRHIKSVQVGAGFDVADQHIAQQAQPGDLVITADIPLADEVITKGCLALNPRGELYTKENIRQRLNMRDFMDTMRGSGIDTGGPPPLSQGDRQAFANQLDRFLARKD